MVLIVIGIFYYRGYQHTARQEALHAAMRIQNSRVGPSQSDYVVSFPTAEARKTAVVKAWRDFAAKYPGTEEGAIAEFFWAPTPPTIGNLPEAAKHFQAAIDSGGGPYASAAKLALAQVYAAQGKVNDGIAAHPVRD